jgi:LytS/YehU family sensor histidine kinase
MNGSSENRKKQNKMFIHQNDITLPQEQKAGSLRDLELFKMLLQPHFLFNSLNNLYALSVKKSDQTTEAIAGLSDLLAKVVSCSRQEYITLDQEIELIKDYISLERIWLGETTFLLDLQVSGATSGVQLPPLVLYTFVENCFKHGVRKCNGDGWLTIRIDVKEGVLRFKSRNLVPSWEDEMCSERSRNSGLGIMAVKELLEKKCTDKYELKTGRKGKTYAVDLVIKCK